MYGDPARGLRHYRDAWHAQAGLGDEIGLHVHTQRWSQARAGFFAENRDPAWIERCTRVGFAAYERAFGRPAGSFRFGNRFMDTPLARLLTGLGVRYDLTLEPGYPGRGDNEKPHSGYCPSYLTAPREPYRAAENDMLCPDPARRSGPWFIPLSAAPLGDRPQVSRLPYHRAVAPQSNRYDTFRLTLEPEVFRRGIDHLLGELARPYLAVVIRAANIRNPAVAVNLEALHSHPQAGRFRFTTPAEALRRLGYERSQAP